MLGGAQGLLYVRCGQVNSLGEQGRMEIEYKQKGMRRQSGWVKYGGCLTEHPMTRHQAGRGGNRVKDAFTQVAIALLSLLVESDGQ
jgi:hypothetical protein